MTDAEHYVAPDGRDYERPQVNADGLHLASDDGVITILYLYFWRESAINLGWLMNAHIPRTILVTS